MSTNYKKITDLTLLDGELLKDDMILMARKDTTDIGYTTYKSLFQTLSSNLINNVKHEVLSIALLTSVNQLKPTATLSAIAGNVGYQLSTSIDYANTVNSEQQTQINGIRTDLDQLSTSIPSKIQERMSSIRISNSAPTIYNYTIKKATTKSPIDVSDYYNQGITILESKDINVNLSCVTKGPLIHIVSKDSIVVVSQSKCSTNLHIFVNSKVKSVDSTTKQDIFANQSDSYKSGWSSVGRFTTENEIIQIPCAKNTCLCFYQNATRTDASYIPNYKVSFSVNANIRVEEFS